MYTTARDGTKVAKGLKMVLEEHGVSTAGRGADWMRETLTKHSDFRDEKSMIEHFRLTAIDAKWRRVRNARERSRRQLVSAAIAVRATLPVLREKELDVHAADNLQDSRQHYSVLKVFIINSSSKIAIQ